MTPTTRNTVRVVGSVVAILMVLTAAQSAVAQASRHSATSTHELPRDLATVRLVNDVGSVTVMAVAADEPPRAEVTATGGFRKPDVDVAAAGDTAELTGGCPSDLWFGPCDVEWTLFVPEGTATSLLTSVGDITVSGTDAPIRAEASVGSVTVSGVSGETIDLQSSVGEIVAHLDTSPDRLTATTSTGDIHVTVPDDETTYRVRSATSLGEVRTGVAVDETSAHHLDLVTSLGDVTVAVG